MTQTKTIDTAAKKNSLWLVLLVALMALVIGVVVGRFFGVGNIANHAMVQKYLPAKQMLNDQGDFQSLQLLPQPKILAPLNLINANGDEVTELFFHNHWSLIYFGFSQCPDLCPLELQTLAKMYHQLTPAQQQQLQLVFISVDPERDQPEHLRSYTQYFDKRMQGLTGTNGELARVAQNFAVFYERSYMEGEQNIVIAAGQAMPNSAGKNYQVIHSSRLFLVSPEGDYIGSFPSPHIAETMAADVAQLLSH